MKHIIFLALIQFCACAEPETPRAVLVALETPFAKPVQRAYNVAISNHSVTATYINSDASFTLRFDQCAVIEMDGKTELVDAAVFQISTGVYVAEIRGCGYVRVNTVTGITSVNWGGVNRVYTKNNIP
jgi:hypothetical protein